MSSIGMCVGEFLQRELFDPLGMTSTGYRFFGDIERRMVPMYRFSSAAYGCI